MITASSEQEPSDDNAATQSSAANSLTIRTSDLLPGDFLLFRSIKQKRHQKEISKRIGSPYTHAAIYLGDGDLAEATPPRVRITSTAKAITANTCIGVLRTQYGFDGPRPQKLREFIDELISQKAKYDLSGVLNFTKKNQAYFQDQLDIINRNYGQVTPRDKFIKRSYFCSALVVACYTIVGIIGESAQVAYPPDVLSPASLYRDPTFGWFLGYLSPAGHQVPAQDPLESIMSWRDAADARWWP
jgi:Permuted papain-like amidase enzyme, YaeF/YiiX, C92 family